MVMNRSTAWYAILLAVMAAGMPARAAEVGPLVRVSRGDPFTGCTADKLAAQPGVKYPATEIEPYLAVNPAHPGNLLVGFQQDRFSNGGSRGLVGAVSSDGGATWKRSIPGGTAKCTGGPYFRASDPWVSFASNGVAYFMHLVLGTTAADADAGTNAMEVSRSSDGGRTWGRPITLIRDTNPQLFNDKNSLTADPGNPSFAYAVWDRLEGALAEEEQGGGEEIAGAAKTPAASGRDGVQITRDRLRAVRTGRVDMKARAAAEAVVELPPKGPTLFARTSNGGRTWQSAKVIYDPGILFQTIGNQIVVQPSGTVIDFFNEINQANGAMKLGLVRSFDKGANFESRPHYVAAQNFSITGTRTPNFGEFVRDANILFDTAVDPRTGVLYIVWQDTRFRLVDEVAFSTSIDGGLSWSDPIKVNQTPGNVNFLREQAFIPQVEVGPNGIIVVTYYDFRNDRDAGGEATDHWAAFCDPRVSNCKRPASWRNEVRLTNRSFDILKAPFAGGLFLGDYMGLARSGRHGGLGVRHRRRHRQDQHLFPGHQVRRHDGDRQPLTCADLHPARLDRDRGLSGWGRVSRRDSRRSRA